MDEARRVLGFDLTQEEMALVTFVDTAQLAAQDADALIIITDWKEFKTPDFESLLNTMNGSVIIDGRNLFDPQHVRSKGFIYKPIGR
jgi:UDPglucose 6-dehydrogenase